MKYINKILIILSLGFILSYAAEDVVSDVMNQDESTMYNTSGFEETKVSAEPTELISEESEVLDAQSQAQEQAELAESGAEDNGGFDPFYEDAFAVEDVNDTMKVSQNMSEFEKLFINHSAHIYYIKAIDELQKANYKVAYENAMKAKVIFDNTNEGESQVIALPYMPSYIRESSYTPKRIYYKVVKPKPYELKRLITKTKLISPPVASVVLKRTSTYMEVITKNYGDLPLDEFEVLLNDESIVKYEKILPNEQKITRVELAPSLYEISFKEKYGFAPNSIMLSEGE